MQLKNFTLAALAAAVALGAAHTARADGDGWGGGPVIGFGYAPQFYAPPPPPPVYYAPPQVYYQPQQSWQGWGDHQWHHEDDDDEEHDEN